MRLFLLPLSTRRTFIYCDKHFAISPKKLITAGSTSINRTPKTSTSTASSEVQEESQPSAQSYIDKITTKAASTWSGWEQAEGGWKKQLTTYGNAALRRIPYEEWGLKSFPPINNKRQDDALAQYQTKPVGVLFPPSFLKPSEVETTLLKLSKERQTMHQQRMWYCLVGAPLTLPFALIPVIPNIPGFYLLFRAWSHYRALYGARHLQYLVENNLYKATPSTELDRIYATINSAAASGASPAATAVKIHQRVVGGEEEVPLLTKAGGQQLAKTFELNELGVELERAVEQVENIVLKKDAEAKEVTEKKEQ